MCQSLREIFVRENKAIKFLPGPTAIGIRLKKISPSCIKKQDSGEGRKRIYAMPTLEQARKEWEAHMHQAIDWEDPDS